ncbi:MAG: MurR/RpiR family transcriptional regulator, partial [Proteobacteria bacterium]|nr:MurR/RpiR family transcriptional regulator [Pseudomonadota bacterium]
RLAERLGFDGFVGLQAAVRAELSERLRPAHERIRVSPRDDVLGHTLAVEVENVRRTLEAADPEVFAAAVERLADPERRVSVLPSEQCVSAAENLASSLSLLRDGVRLLTGSEFRVTSQLARMRRTDTVVLIDLQRHETWFLRTAERVVDRGAHRIAITDRPDSPIATSAHETFLVAADSAGPFDSQVGVAALCNALANGVSAYDRRAATRRIDALERYWVETGILAD